MGQRRHRQREKETLKWVIPVSFGFLGIAVSVLIAVASAILANV
jgi:hypothetical protein